MRNTVKKRKKKKINYLSILFHHIRIVPFWFGLCCCFHIAWKTNYTKGLTNKSGVSQNGLFWVTLQQSDSSSFGMKSNFEISAWAMGQNQPNQDCHNLGKYIHAQFLPKKWHTCYWLILGTTSDVLWHIGLLWSALITKREGESECGFFPVHT